MSSAVKSTFVNAIAIFINVKNGPKPVNKVVIPNAKGEQKTQKTEPSRTSQTKRENVPQGTGQKGNNAPVSRNNQKHEGTTKTTTKGTTPTEKKQEKPVEQVVKPVQEKPRTKILDSGEVVAVKVDEETLARYESFIDEDDYEMQRAARKKPSHNVREQETQTAKKKRNKNNKPVRKNENKNSNLEEKILFFELSESIKSAIKRLPARERELIECKFFKDKKLREISEEFNLSPSRISRIIQSGLNKIRKELSKQNLV